MGRVYDGTTSNYETGDSVVTPVPDPGAPLMAVPCLPLPGQRRLPLWMEDPRWWLFGYLAVAINAITLYLLGVDLIQAQILALIPILVLAEVFCRITGRTLFTARLSTVPRLLTGNPDPPNLHGLWLGTGPRLA